MVMRKCAGCGEIKDRKDLIKITRENASHDIVLNPDSKIFGRSVYLCYNKSCIEQAFKKNRISKILKAPVAEDLKGKILNEF